ncbi:MAG TPA: ABC transporter substrate-binding protein [Polyangiaceae bacterium]|jgi:phospholipid transport system substrate-binding protein|nr:ABC transporter substrate-binding protein [Polyangiaceae bacterium]
MFRRDFLAASCLLLTLAPVAAHAAEGADATEARGFIVNLHRELLAAIKASKNPKTDPALMAIFDRALDYTYLTTETLGKNFDALTPEQRATYGDILKRLVQASYRRNLKDPSGFEVEYAGELPVEGAVLVQTVTKNKKNKRDKPLSVDYQVALVSGARRVQDIATGGVSIVRNYRKQFGSIINKKGVDELLKMMKTKLDELDG